jgi:hypothetical protein
MDRRAGPDLRKGAAVDITDGPRQDDGRVLPVLQARAADLLSDARLALRSGQWQQLRALANAVLALDPGNTEAEELLVGSAQRRQMTLMFCDIVGLHGAGGRARSGGDQRHPARLPRNLRKGHRALRRVHRRPPG